jgi:hypothetical protein
MLLSVTDEGYGLWSDNIWVNYEGTIRGAEDDVITVYGTITGDESYEPARAGDAASVVSIPVSARAAWPLRRSRQARRSGLPRPWRSSGAVPSRGAAGP